MTTTWRINGEDGPRFGEAARRWARLACFLAGGVGVVMLPMLLIGGLRLTGDAEGWAALGVWAILAFVVGRFSRETGELWAIAFAVLLVMAVSAAVGAAGGTTKPGEGALLAVGVAVATLVVAALGQGLVDMSTALARATTPELDLERAIEQVARRGGSLRLSGDAPIRVPPGRDTALADVLPGRRRMLADEPRLRVGYRGTVDGVTMLRGELTVAGVWLEDLEPSGWRPTDAWRAVYASMSPGVPERAADDVSVERAWMLPPATPSGVARELRDVITLLEGQEADRGSPAAADGAVTSRRRPTVSVEDAIEPETADLGSLVVGPIVVVVSAALLWVSELLSSDPGGWDHFLFASACAALGWLVVVSVGRSLLPRLPRARDYADGAWWLGLLFLPPVAGLAGFFAALAALPD